MASNEEYAEKIVVDFMRDITDHVFLSIQRDESLMREYQTQVHQSSLQSVNTAIGKSVREIFDLENIGESKTPKSWLIKSFMQHGKSE